MKLIGIVVYTSFKVEVNFKAKVFPSFWQLDTELSKVYGQKIFFTHFLAIFVTTAIISLPAVEFGT